MRVTNSVTNQTNISVAAAMSDGFEMCQMVLDYCLTTNQKYWFSV